MHITYKTFSIFLSHTQKKGKQSPKGKISVDKIFQYKFPVKARRTHKIFVLQEYGNNLLTNYLFSCKRAPEHRHTHK